MLGERKLNNGQVSLGLSMNIFDHINTDDWIVKYLFGTKGSV